MLLRDMIDLDLLKGMFEQGMISMKSHNDDSTLFILNYTAAAQYSRTWNEATKQCRGLIVKGEPLVDLDSVVVARPFSKFFNVSEHGPSGLEALPNTAFDVFEKMDGSLGILYKAPDGLPAIATRGSFHSDQAKWATKFYRENYAHVGNSSPETTMLFEIIYPTNRIVVNYGDTQDLVLLAAIDIETGSEVETDLLETFPKAKAWNGITSLEQIKELTISNPVEYANQEGFVLRFKPTELGTPSIRAKAKFSEYVRLHHILTGITARSIYLYAGVAFLKARGYEPKEIAFALRISKESASEIFDSAVDPMERLLVDVPDEFYIWVNEVLDNLQEEYRLLDTQGHHLAEDVAGKSRREIAELIKESPVKHLVFRIIDNRDVSRDIWSMIRPNNETPFKTDIDS